MIAGDIETAKTRAAVEKWFADVKPGATPVGPIDYPHPNLTEVKKKTIQDRVQLPRLYLTWLTPAHLEPGDAELDVLSLLLAGGKNSRLYKRLVYELQIAQDVAAFQASKALNSEYQIVVTARPTASIDKIRAVVDEEIAKIQQAPPTAREFTRAINQVESSFYDRMERVGDFGGVGDQMNSYYFAAGQPGVLQRGPVALSRALAGRHPGDRTEVPAAEQTRRARRGANQVKLFKRSVGRTSQVRRIAVDAGPRGPAYSSWWSPPSWWRRSSRSRPPIARSRRRSGRCRR